MCDLLKFMDSLQVREYNRKTYFTPAEWAVIAVNSITATVEEKMDALQYLTEHYAEEDFARESVNVGPGHVVYHNHLPSREDVRETMRIWKETLEDRYKGDGFVYAAGYEEKGRYWPGQIEGYRFLPDYEKAFMYLKEMRDKKRESKSFRKEDFFGEIERLKCYVDGGYSDVLQGAVCAEEELPENQQMLKRISAVYKGEMAFMELLSQFSKREI